MGKRLYVGNLNFAMTDTALRDLVGRLTSVAVDHLEHAEILRDHKTGQSRGFGFVDLADAEDAQHAIDELDGVEVMGRRLRVQLAKPRARSLARDRI